MAGEQGLWQPQVRWLEGARLVGVMWAGREVSCDPAGPMAASLGDQMRWQGKGRRGRGVAVEINEEGSNSLQESSSKRQPLALPSRCALPALFTQGFVPQLPLETHT